MASSRRMTKLARRLSPACCWRKTTAQTHDEPGCVNRVPPVSLRRQSMSWLMFWRRRDEPGAVSPHHMAHGGLVAPDRVPFALPKNIRETYRLDQQHYFLRRDLPGNHAAPLSRPGAILDIGCGTGRWAMELAAEFPHAR